MCDEYARMMMAEVKTPSFTKEKWRKSGGRLEQRVITSADSC